ncbi:MAG: hypothetical protein KY445_04180 [Armatimonadetes bacterium]|nr:hypothetical protein [Armatimonadota bacterium]
MRRFRAPCFAKMRPEPPFQPIAFALDSAREDGKAQKERDALIRQAADFIGELVQHANAYSEELPRGYRVVPVRGRKDKKKGVIPPRIELRQTPRGFFAASQPLKIAVLGPPETLLFETRDFVKHLNAGLLGEIGDHFIERCRKSRRETSRLESSLADIENIKRHLAHVERGE